MRASWRMLLVDRCLSITPAFPLLSPIPGEIHPHRQNQHLSAERFASLQNTYTPLSLHTCPLTNLCMVLIISHMNPRTLFACNTTQIIIIIGTECIDLCKCVYAMQLISSMKAHFKPFLHLVQVQQASKQRKLNTFHSTLNTGVHITVT
jgi:hypothetical protein